eukprot:TRINITY_DN36892_c0_g2_i1.p1 TRINITY_DN36892_c0_g2~~TRINITY_DN36892_c0_g2_i1.p1  ORF type:complete len:436 (+),score=122.35 TRINITY_DN36892_c0_g2_i1:96-1403(+)
MMSRAVVLLLLLLHVGGSFLGKQGGGLRRQGLQRKKSSTCSCDCCNVAKRRPDERNGGASVKCALGEGHSRALCSGECSPAAGDSVLAPVAQDGVVDYSRFCFHECKPAKGLTSPIATQCLALEASQAARLVDADGNPMDPAFLYEEKGSSTEEAALLLKGTEPAEVDPAAAKEAAIDGRAAAQEALRSSGADIERLGETKVATEIPDLGATDPLTVASETRSLALKAEDLASKAAEDADRSIQALKSGRNETWKSAMWQANKAISFMKRSDYRIATMPTNPWRAQATMAARKAAAPYLQSAKAYGQDAAFLNRQAAYDARNQAQHLREQADSLETQSAIEKNNGATRKAELMAEQSDVKDEQAGKLDQEAQELLKAARQGDDFGKKGFAEDAKEAAFQAASSLKLPIRYQWALPPDPLRKWVPDAPSPFAKASK